MRLILLVIACVVGACGSSQTLGAEGSSVTLRGRISESPKQALEQGVAGKVSAHFDYGTDDKVVIYWVSAPACRGDIEITGTVKVESAPSKGGSEMIRERVVDVDSARCAE